MSAICASSILACGLRVTLLDSTGNVANQANNYYVTQKMTELQFTPDIYSPNEITLASGCACIIVTAKFPDLLKRFTFQLSLGALEPALIALLTGGATISSGGVPFGFDWPVNLQCGQTPPPKIALEVWSYVWESDHQSQTLPYWHWVWPETQWQFAQSTLNTDAMVVQLTGFSTANPVWGHGPYGDGPGVNIAALGAVWQTATVPPVGVCGLQTVVPSS